MMRSSKKIQLFFILIIFVFSISAVFPQSKKEVKQWNKWQKKVTKTKDTDKQIKILRTFVKKYPKHFFIKEARAKVAEISFYQVEKKNTFDAYKKYADKFSESKYIPQVKEKIAGFAYKNAEKENTVTAYQEFMDKYPDSKLLPLAKEKIANFAYKKAKKEDKIKSYEDFIAEYPDSKFAQEAKEEIINLKRLEQFKFVKKSELKKLILTGHRIAAATSINNLLDRGSSGTMAELLIGEWTGSYGFKYNGKSLSFPIRISVSGNKENLNLKYFDKKGREIIILKEKIREYYIFERKILMEFIYGRMTLKSDKIALGANINFNLQELVTFLVELNKTK